MSLLADLAASLPALPLTRGVPVIDPDADGTSPRLMVIYTSAGAVVTVNHLGLQPGVHANPERLRIDLTSPIGFGYALRLLVLSDSKLPGVKRRHWQSVTTDADRWAVARSLSVVFS